MKAKPEMVEGPEAYARFRDALRTVLTVPEATDPNPFKKPNRPNKVQCKKLRINGLYPRIASPCSLCYVSSRGTHRIVGRHYQDQRVVLRWRTNQRGEGQTGAFVDLQCGSRVRIDGMSHCPHGA